HLAWLRHPSHTVAGEEIDDFADLVYTLNGGNDLRVQVQDEWNNPAGEPAGGGTETITLTLVPPTVVPAIPAASVHDGGDDDPVSSVTVNVVWDADGDDSTFNAMEDATIDRGSLSIRKAA